MNSRNIAVELVDALVRPDGDPDRRPVHTWGVGATGCFVASPVARDYCAARHFAGDSIDITVRFSNGSGSATRHDGWSDVRGMATRFHLGKEEATDLIAMTLPEFFAPTPETTLDFFREAKPAPCRPQSPWRKILDMLALTAPMRDPYPGERERPDEGAMRFADWNAFARLAVLQAASIGAPLSYERAAYHAVHTFVVRSVNDVRRHVRFTWQPIDGVENIPPAEVTDDDYLAPTLRRRLDPALVPPRFSLMMAIGEAGDYFDDPTRPWPPKRARVMMGTLTLKSIAEASGVDVERLSFNPCLLTDGIELSDDPVLRVRREAYELSSRQRGAAACPFAASRGQTHGE